MGKPQLAWIGLGNMGQAMANNIQKYLTKEQYPPLIVFNRTASRADPLKEHGVIVAKSLEEAVQKSDIIYTCLAKDSVVQDTYSRLGELPIQGKLFVEASTIHPDVTKATEKLILAKGAEFVAGPVFGAPAAAVAGQLILAIAGNPSSIAKIHPFTEGVICRATIQMGEDVAKAPLLKITGNTMILGMVEILAEALVFAEKSGLGTDKLKEYIELFFPNSPISAYCGRMLSGDYAPVPPKRPGFQIDLARKDCKHAMDIAAASGTRLEVTEIMDKHLARAKEIGGDNMDISTTYGTIRKDAGLKFSDTIE